MTERKKVVVVGAGMAGLTTAAYLSKQEVDVLLIERNERTGGLVNTFERDGFFFDTGPRAFVNSGMVKPILNDLGVECEFVQNTITIAIEDQLLKIDTLDSLDGYQKLLVNLYPENEKEIDKIVKYIYKLSKHTEVLYKFDNPYFVDYVSNKRVFFLEFLPWTIKLLNSLRNFNKYSSPVEDFLGNITDNKSLTDILTQHFFKKTPTYFALGYFHVYLDYFYPKKGTTSLPVNLTKLVEEQGVEIKLNTTITEVNPFQKEVIDASGNRYEYDELVWASDLKTLYKLTDDHGLEDNVVEKIKVQRNRIIESNPAESAYIIFAGVDRPSTYFEEISGEHMFYTPSRQGLGEVNNEIKQKLIDDFDQLSENEVLEWVEEFCRLNTFEVSIPTLRDPSLSPQNKTSLMISCLFDYDIAEKIEQAGYTKRFIETMENTIVDSFSKSIFKDMKEDIIFTMSATPLTINKYTGNTKGGIVGWSFESTPPVKNRLRDIPKSVLTPFPNIYQAGQWSYAPAGVPIAMLTGWHAAQEILKSDKKK